MDQTSAPSFKQFRDYSVFQLQTYNLGHNISELYNILVEIRLTTSKKKHSIQYSKLTIRVASRVAEQLKTQDLKK